MPRWSIAKARVAWIVGGCSGCGVFVRTIASSVRFHSMTAFGAGVAGAAVVLGGAVEGVGHGMLVGGACARADGATTAVARRPARTDSLRSVMGVPLCVNGSVGYDDVSYYTSSYICLTPAPARSFPTSPKGSGGGRSLDTQKTAAQYRRYSSSTC